MLWTLWGLPPKDHPKYTRDTRRVDVITAAKGECQLRRVTLRDEGWQNLSIYKENP